MRTWLLGPFGRCVAVLIVSASSAVFASGQPESSTLTKKQVEEQHRKFQAERKALVDSGAATRFLPELLQKADVFARRGAAALESGRLLQAWQAFRLARWQLPYQGPDVPDHVARVLGSTRLRHSGPVHTVRFRPDGRFFASGGVDRTVRIWSMDNGHEVQRLIGHGSNVRSVAFSRDGRYLASAGGDDFIQIWDTESGKILRTLKPDSTSARYVLSVALSPDGKYLVSAWNDKAVRIYIVADGKQVRKIGDFRQAVNHVAFSKDGKVLSAAAGDGQVRLWEWPKAAEGKNVPAYWAFSDLRGASYHIAFNTEGTYFARCYAEGIKIYRTPLPGQEVSGEPVVIQITNPKNEDGGDEGRFTCSVFSPDGKKLFAGATDSRIRIYDVSNGRLLGTLAGHNDQVTDLAIHPDGTDLLSASLDYTIRKWTFNVVSMSRKFEGHTGPVWTAEFNSNRTQVLTASADRSVRIWEIGAEKGRLIGRHESPVTVARFSPDDKLVASAGGDAVIKLWDASTGKHVADLKGHTATITYLAFSPDGTRLASCGADRHVKVWDVRKQSVQFDIPTPSIVTSVTFRPDGQWLATSHVDQEVRLWSAQNGKLQVRFVAHGDSVNCVTYSVDGRFLATCGSDGLVKVWKGSDPLAEPALLTTFSGHEGAVSFAEFHPNGKFVASGGADGIVRLWKLSEGDTDKAVQEFRGHTAWVSSVRFSKDGYFLASASVDKTVRLWELASRESPVVSEHSGTVKTVVALPDGQRIASSATDKTIKIWDLTTGAELLTLRGHKAPVAALAVTADGKTLASAGLDRNVYRWSTETGKRLEDGDGHKANFYSLIAAPRMLHICRGNELVMWLAPQPRSTTLVRVRMDTGEKLSERKDPGRFVTAVALAKDGNLAALAGQDGSVRLYEYGDKWNVLPGGDWFLFDNNEAINSIALTRDGKTLAAGSEKGTVRIARISDRKVLHTIKAHGEQVHLCRVSPDGSRVATAGYDNAVKLWDVQTGKLLRQWQIRSPIQIYGAFVSDMDFTPDGRKLVTANSNTTLYVLELP